jgi:hypothetical protein
VCRTRNSNLGPVYLVFAKTKVLDNYSSVLPLEWCIDVWKKHRSEDRIGCGQETCNISTCDQRKLGKFSFLSMNLTNFANILENFTKFLVSPKWEIKTLHVTKWRNNTRRWDSQFISSFESLATLIFGSALGGFHFYLRSGLIRLLHSFVRTGRIPFFNKLSEACKNRPAYQIFFSYGVTFRHASSHKWKINRFSQLSYQILTR